MIQDVFDVDDKIQRTEEAQPSKLGIEDSNPSRSGRNNQALTAEASMVRARQTELHGGWARLEKDADNKYVRSKFENEINRNSVQAVNAHIHQLPPAAKSRYMNIVCQTQVNFSLSWFFSQLLLMFFFGDRIVRAAASWSSSLAPSTENGPHLSTPLWSISASTRLSLPASAC
jgi:hypothetical protein